MILQFRTEQNKNGHARYLAIDTGAEAYSTQPRGWISKDIPKLSVKDYRYLCSLLEKYEFKKVDFIC